MQRTELERSFAGKKLRLVHRSQVEMRALYSTPFTFKKVNSVHSVRDIVNLILNAVQASGFHAMSALTNSNNQKLFVNISPSPFSAVAIGPLF